jgi:hypothetical protein
VPRAIGLSSSASSNPWVQERRILGITDPWNGSTYPARSEPDHRKTKAG